MVRKSIKVSRTLRPQRDHLLGAERVVDVSSCSLSNVEGRPIIRRQFDAFLQAQRKIWLCHKHVAVSREI